MKYDEYLKQLSRLEMNVNEEEDNGVKSVSIEKFVELIHIVEGIVEDLKRKEKDKEETEYYKYMGDDM
ncbi:hypothetical protein L8C07_05875 [Paenibacillus sp. CMAA1739]|uniref:hypothetical protein n=1 Tax=Paenibacillus ottowii TaxID=2315729 RepID=UPI002DBA0AB1|nr:hypothetical protein [Paenibacillus sp. CMAA1739]MEC4565467.1 hypothetical protein [Paenibacillus sp. CMAA1739]